MLKRSCDGKQFYTYVFTVLYIFTRNNEMKKRFALGGYVQKGDTAMGVVSCSHNLFIWVSIGVTRQEL